jgi:hypothetical protein
MGRLSILLQYLHDEGCSIEAEDLTSEVIRAFVVYL